MAEVKANTAWDWLKKWWLWLVLGAAAILFILSRLLPTTSKGKPELLQKAKDEAKDAKDDAAKTLEEHNKEMDKRQEELDKIKAITNEAARLQALADFANRHK